MKKLLKVVFFQTPQFRFSDNNNFDLFRAFKAKIEYHIFEPQTLAETQSYLDEHQFDFVLCDTSVNFSIWRLERYCITKINFIVVGKIEDILKRELQLANFTGNVSIQTPQIKLNLAIGRCNTMTRYACPSIHNMLTILAFLRLMEEQHSSFGINLSIYYSLYFREQNGGPLPLEKYEVLNNPPVFMTPRDLLGHKTGIHDPEYTSHLSPLLRLKYILTHLNEKKDYHYSTCNYQIMALVIDVYTRNYTDYFKEELMPSMGITDVLFQTDYPDDTSFPKLNLPRIPDLECINFVNELDKILAENYWQRVKDTCIHYDYLLDVNTRLLPLFFKTNDTLKRIQLKQDIMDAIDTFANKDPEELLILQEIEAFIAFFDEEYKSKQGNSTENLYLYHFYKQLKSYITAENWIEKIKQLLTPNNHLDSMLFFNLDDINKIEDALLSPSLQRWQKLMFMEQGQNHSENIDYLLKPHGLPEDSAYALEHMSRTSGLQSGFFLYPNLNYRISYLSTEDRAQVDTIRTVVDYLFFGQKNGLFYLDDSAPSHWSTFNLDKFSLSIIDTWNTNQTISL